MFSFVRNLFGPPPSPKDIRLKEAVSRYEKKLSEAWDQWEAYADPQAYYAGWGPNFAPTGMNPNPLADKSTKRVNASILSEGQLRIQRNFARMIDSYNPIAQGFMRHLVNFVIRRGFTYRYTDKARPKLAAQVNAYVDSWSKKNRWIKRQREFFQRSVRDGEGFFRFGKNQHGTTVRFAEPEQVTNPPGAAEGWAYGVHCDPEDAEDVIEYYFRDLEGTGGEYVQSEDVIHFKRNVDMAIRRGVSDFFSLQDDFEGADRLLANTREGTAINEAIALIRKHEAADPSAVGDFITARADLQQTNPYTGRSINLEKFPAGAIVDAGAGLTFEAPAGRTHADAIGVLSACMRVICLRWGMPEFMTADASNANLASTLVAGSPFIEMVKCEQTDYCDPFEAVIRRVVADAIEDKRLPKEAASLDLQCEPPEPTMIDPLQQAQQFQVYAQNKWFSPQTIQQKLGVDSDEEQENVETWEARHGPMMPAEVPGMGGGATEMPPTTMPSMEAMLHESDCGCKKCRNEELEECDEGVNKGKPGVCPAPGGKKSSKPMPNAAELFKKASKRSDAKAAKLDKQDAAGKSGAPAASAPPVAKFATGTVPAPKVEKARDTWLGMAKKVGQKALNAVRGKVQEKFGKLEERYGRKMAVAIMGAMIVGAPIPVPGSSFLMAAPFVIGAELHKRYAAPLQAAMPAMEAAPGLTPEEIDELGKKLAEELKALAEG